MSSAGADRGNRFYDEPKLVAAYLNHRHGAVTSPNLVMEDPAFMSEVRDLSGQHILDLGCGDGTFANTCAAEGCERYLGVDGSQLMINRASGSASSPNVDFRCDDLEDYEPDADCFDLVVSRMALHYLPDLQPVMARVSRALRPGGRFVFSVVHPILTAAIDAPEGQRTSQKVDNYFSAGERHRQWFGASVTWQHRTIENYLDAVLSAGFRIDSVRECEPVPKLFAGNEAEYQRRLRAPVFLLIAATSTA